jgi:hypothetical protein
MMVSDPMAAAELMQVRGGVSMKLWKLAAPVAAALALTACGPSNSGSAGGPGGRDRHSAW